LSSGDRMKRMKSAEAVDGAKAMDSAKSMDGIEGE
jgi:hypothetical protein